MHKPQPVPLRAIPARLWSGFLNFFTQGWYFHGDPMSTDRLRLVMCNYTSNIIANLIGGSFLTGLLLLMDADDAFIGTITMISTSANLLQLFAPLLLERFSHRKRILTAMRALVYLLNVGLVALAPLMPLERQGRLMVTAILVFLANIISALIGPGLTCWHIQSIPGHVRQGYFSLITMTVGAVVAVGNLAGSRIIDLFKEWGMEYQGMLVVRGIALALAGVEILLYSRIREYPYESTGERLSARQLLLAPFRNKLYLCSVLASFLWNFSANIPSSYFTVYLLKNIGVSYSYIMVLSMLNVPAVLLLTPLWRRVLQRLDWFKTLHVAMLIYALHYTLLGMTTPSTMFFYPTALILSYVMGIGITLSINGMPYVNIPEQNQTAFIGFYSTAANLAALLGVTFSKYFILFTENHTLNLFGFEMINKQYLMLLTSALMLLAAMGVFWIDRSVKKQTAQLNS